MEAYAPPGQQPVSVSETTLPTGLKAICIIAMILGAIGLLMALASGAQLALGSQMQTAFAPGPGAGDAQLQELQGQMQEQINTIVARYLPWHVVSALLHAISAVLLLVGSIMTLRRSTTGRQILILACAVSIIYVISNGILEAVVQMQTIPVVQSFMGDAMAEAADKAGGGGDAQQAKMAAEMIPKFIMAAVFIGMAFSALFILIKIVFYGVSVFYLRKPHIRAFFPADQGVPKGV
jgi:energy-converting hydrogenase Eha subunit C